MGSRRQGAGKRLAVDVALVDHRQAFGLEDTNEFIDGGTGGGGDTTSVVIDVAHARHIGECQVQAAGECHRREGVPGTGHSHVQPFAGCFPDHGTQLILTGRGATSSADAGLVADPVAPMGVLDSEFVDVHVVR
ncbi:hypothetical protein D3C81_1689270 [compost metagenome]